jgi:hypothetical protein
MVALYGILSLTTITALIALIAIWLGDNDYIDFMQC